QGTPSQLVIGRNSKNTNANGPDGSSLAEPAAANNARAIFAAGNFDHAEFSTDGGAAAQSAVGIDDDFTAGIGVFSLVLTATGTHNRSQNDERFGDYFTIHPYEPCEKWFTATNYALLNGTTASNVNSRYVEF